MDIQEISSKLFQKSNDAQYPCAEDVIGMISKIKMVVFPEYFNKAAGSATTCEWTQALLADIRRELSKEIQTAMSEQKDAASLADKISDGLLGKLADIQQLLYKDAQAGFDGDPAARSVDEVIVTYPGFFAVFVYRVAHVLFSANVPVIPRIMSEHAHSITGIDIHPGAQIGESFFIDHGTGVVIGETTIIGNYVKLYQGVTLGALSTQSGQKLAGKKRHPTIEDNVTIYSGATILGGDTIIGKGSIIGGNVFITKSVPAKTVVKMISPELKYKDGSGIKSGEFTGSDAWFYQI